MARKQPKWTKAMRARAAEHGRRGNVAGKRRGGLVSWHGKTPDQQAVVLATLTAGRGRQTNTSPKARAAQRARGLAGMKRLTGAKARFLADMGMLRREPLPAAAIVAPGANLEPEGVVPAPPWREDYPDVMSWHRDVKVWEARWGRPARWPVRQK